MRVFFLSVMLFSCLLTIAEADSFDISVSADKTLNSYFKSILGSEDEYSAGDRWDTIRKQFNFKDPVANSNY